MVETWLAFLLFGSEFPGAALIPRLYTAHVLLVPGAIATLIALHMAILIRQKHTHFAGPGAMSTTSSDHGCGPPTPSALSRSCARWRPWRGRH